MAGERMARAREESQCQSTSISKPRGLCAVSDGVPKRKLQIPWVLQVQFKRHRLIDNSASQGRLGKVTHLLGAKGLQQSQAACSALGRCCQSKAQLPGAALQMVAALHLKFLPFALKDRVFKESQWDWPGCSETGRQTHRQSVIELMFSRKLSPLQSSGTSLSPAMLLFRSSLWVPISRII